MPKGPATDATDAPQPWGLLCNPVMKMISFLSFFRVMEHRWSETDRGKAKYSGEKTCPSATLSTTNPKCTDPGSNPNLRGRRPAANRLGHGKATGGLILERWSTGVSNYDAASMQKRVCLQEFSACAGLRRRHVTKSSTMDTEILQFLARRVIAFQFTTAKPDKQKRGIYNYYQLIMNVACM
jgi:hypothetical protein